MDRKGIAILVIAFALLLGLQPLAKLLFPVKPGAPGSTNAIPTLPTAGNLQTTNVASVPNLDGVVPIPPATALPTVPTGPAQLLALTNASTRWVFTSHGGGIHHVELQRYSEFTGRIAKGRSNAPVLINDGGPPALALHDSAHIEGDGVYQLTPIENGLRAEKDLANGLRIIREYRLTTNDHLLHAVLQIQNRTAQVLDLRQINVGVGAAGPINTHDKGDLISVDWFNGNKAIQTLGWVPTPGFLCVPSSPRQDYRGGEGDVVWAAVQNQFFALITYPDRSAREFSARRIPLPPLTGEQRIADPGRAESQALVPGVLHFDASPLPAGGFVEHRFTVYAGPKEYFGLSRLQPQFDRVMGYGFFGFFAKPLLLSMNFLHNSLSLPYGWCIVVITFLIKLIFWPLTAVSTRSMKRMAELGPQLQAIREKYKDDPTRLNEKTLQFMRESGYNPVAGCLPMLVQIPVFIGFFTMLRSAIELRGASFFWCPDLSAADTLFVIPGLGFVPFLGISGVGLPLNLMPLFYVATALWQTHLTPPSPQMDPTQQKIMRWMPLMFLALFYNYSAGLTLYWTVQNLLSILQTKLTSTRPPGTAAPTPAARPVKRPAR
jgi:YidC/Oxa1 family membrane protein insertase